MKKYLILLPLLMIIACSKRAANDSVQVMIPWLQEDGSYKQQVVSISTLTDLRTMKGTTADLYVHPGLAAVEGLDGVRPNAQFSRVDGYYMPKDTLSQEMAVIYAHLERLRQLDEDVGLGDLLKWPRQVGVQTLARHASTGQRIHQNAMYVGGKQDTVLFFPYHTSSHLSTSLNAGIIAHEHFHAIFEHLVLKPLQQKFGESILERRAVSKPKEIGLSERFKGEAGIHNRFILRALNEGLADVWGSLYTNQKDFISASLKIGFRTTEPNLTHAGSLDMWVPFIGRETNEDYIMPRAYSLGTTYAQILQQALLEAGLSESSKDIQASFVIDKTLQLRDLLLAGSSPKISSDIILQAIYTEDSLTTDSCQWVLPLLSVNNVAYHKKCGSLK